MNNKVKLIAAGGVIALLLIVVVYLNFFPEAPAPKVSPEAEQVIQQQIEANKQAPPVEPDLTKVPEGARKAGGKATGR
jgi:hypothetical protein